jgi:hypothetical protein
MRKMAQARSVLRGAPNEPATIEMPAPAFTPEVQRVIPEEWKLHLPRLRRETDREVHGTLFQFQFPHRHRIQGKAKVEKISLRDRFFIENLDVAPGIRSRSADLLGISAQAAGGAINGHFEMQLQAEDSPFTASVKFPRWRPRNS